MSFSTSKAEAWLQKLRTTFQTKANMVTEITESPETTTYPSTTAVKDYIDQQIQEVINNDT